MLVFASVWGRIYMSRMVESVPAKYGTEDRLYSGTPAMLAGPHWIRFCDCLLILRFISS